VVATVGSAGVVDILASLWYVWLINSIKVVGSLLIDESCCELID